MRAIDAEMDRLYAAQARERDDKKRFELIRAFEKRALDQAYQVPKAVQACSSVSEISG